MLHYLLLQGAETWSGALLSFALFQEPCYHPLQAAAHLGLHERLQLRLHSDVHLRLAPMQLRQQLCIESTTGSIKLTKHECSCQVGCRHARYGGLASSATHAQISSHASGMQQPLPTPTALVAAALALGRKLKRLAHGQLACG